MSTSAPPGASNTSGRSAPAIKSPPDTASQRERLGHDAEKSRALCRSLALTAGPLAVAFFVAGSIASGGANPFANLDAAPGLAQGLAAWSAIFAIVAAWTAYRWFIAAAALRMLRRGEPLSRVRAALNGPYATKRRRSLPRRVRRIFR